LNVDARGIFLGEFSGEDKILVITKSGQFRTTNFDLSNHFEDDLQIIEKYRVGKIWSAAYYDGEQKFYYLKRFHMEPGTKSTRFIGDQPDSRLIRITEVEYPRLELKFGGKSKDRSPEIIEVAEFIGIKSYKARGKRLSNYEVKIIKELEPLQVIKPKVESPKVEGQEVIKSKVVKPKVVKPNRGESEPSGDRQSQPELTQAKPSKVESETAPVKKKPAKKAEPEKAAPKKTRAKKRVAKPDQEKIKQDPGEVPMEVVKPKEENNKKDPDTDSDSSQQFKLDW